MIAPAAPTSPAILDSPAEMRAWRRALAPGTQVGFVPTMGALHDGHAELLRKLRPRCDRLVLSIFVNPAQFGPNEDLDRYPRTFEADLALARACGVDAVFYPTPASMYPPGYSTYVEEHSLTQGLCGAARPGHFRGVTTVVLKLLNLVEPRLAYFGLKDAQQFFVLHKMARDLDLAVSIEGVATVREPDGLALSSRNRYLSAEDRALAPALHASLERASERLRAGQPVDCVLPDSLRALEDQGFRVQYFECRELPGLQLARGTSLNASPAAADAPRPHLVAVAAQLGTTRLIDNVIIMPEGLAALGIRIHT